MFHFIRKHRKICRCCPGHYLVVNYYSSMSSPIELPWTIIRQHVWTFSNLVSASRRDRHLLWLTWLWIVPNQSLLIKSILLTSQLKLMQSISIHQLEKLQDIWATSRNQLLIFTIFSSSTETCFAWKQFFFYKYLGQYSQLERKNRECRHVTMSLSWTIFTVHTQAASLWCTLWCTVVCRLYSARYCCVYGSAWRGLAPWGI